MRMAPRLAFLKVSSVEDIQTSMSRDPVGMWSSSISNPRGPQFTLLQGRVCMCR
ncbi:hypothetical protein MPTK1_2g03910 [Marchantia polymorpha subsp. ruderalis]|uniref:Uncharacterized protein n=1 Tax=Marchantia polymorpha TaxID=3197 RepID=A0A2R6X7H8_MARPO|nr:hypothetical protein MARPO_0031s0047 [Marchantia polymorpha]PTQ42061.1 hypothetical protein MARPO_0031s0047 [Marchantia polymorpha]BBN01011.1 hypothetical protein Mp_2g03910 [Marchantia polymorpha subsp. ruderalis]BBN01012.1 hypothetical protein Mp_2g03910 [Marchantia polymorpha subsp. ruderalis]|eukprot:PTQ42060.1 hypothetical protein MARPO_0031s0047 [Marchantia polymorpha]